MEKWEDIYFPQERRERTKKEGLEVWGEKPLARYYQQEHKKTNRERKRNPQSTALRIIEYIVGGDLDTLLQTKRIATARHSWNGHPTSVSRAVQNRSGKIKDRSQQHLIDCHECQKKLNPSSTKERWKKFRTLTMNTT